MKAHWGHCSCPNCNTAHKVRRDRERARKRVLAWLSKDQWYRDGTAERHPLPCNCANCIATITREEHAKAQRGEPYTRLWD